MGKLIVVGTGIKSLSHLTEETKVVISSSDHCLYLVTEKNLKDWIKSESRSSESLEVFFDDSIKRGDIYRNITSYILSEVKKYNSLCVVFYGHPVFFASSALLAVTEHKSNNNEAVILPSISSIDVMWSDLCVDPGSDGCCIFEATDFLVNKRIFDIRSHLVLLQVGVIGGDDLFLRRNANILQSYLEDFYPATHQIILYEASVLPGQQPYVEKINLDKLGESVLSKVSTLYIPPLTKAKQDAKMVSRLLDNI